VVESNAAEATHSKAVGRHLVSWGRLGGGSRAFPTVTGTKQFKVVDSRLFLLAWFYRVIGYFSRSLFLVGNPKNLTPKPF
jgi:hypothetical protein